MPGGSIGVSIFFCLSGFLITQILIGLPSLTASNISKFVFRRFMRIFPLYVATLLAALLLAWLSLTYKRGLLPITIADERIDWSPQLAPFGDERPSPVD